MMKFATLLYLTRIMLILGAAVLTGAATAAVFIAPVPRSGEPPGVMTSWLTTLQLKPGDLIELPCGGRWEEGLRLTAVSGVTVRGAPGCAEGERPLIRPLQRLSGWRRESEDLFSVASEPPKGLVMADGKLLSPVMYPASGYLRTTGTLSRPEVRAPGGAWLPVTVTAELVGNEFRGSTLHVRNHPWIIETARVDAFQDAKMRVTGLMHDVPAGALVSLTGQRWMLDEPGARGWAWDGATRRLFLRLAPGLQPAAMDIRIATAEYGVTATGARQLRLAGFDIAGAGVDGVICERCSQVEIDDLRISDVGRDGLNLPGVAGAEVRRLQVSHAARDGIGLVGASAASVVDSIFTEIGTGGWPQSSRAAVNGTHSRDLVATGNRIQRAGYIGIRLNRGSRISQNELVDTCTALDDCGAIYSWADADGQPLHAEISDNLVRRVHGMQNGSPKRYTLAAGIYLDDLSSQVTVRGNTVIDAERGLLLHNAAENYIHGNTFAASRGYAMVVDTGHPRVPGDRMPANTVEDNAFLASRGERVVLVLSRDNRSVRDMLTRNTVVSPSGGPWLQWERKGSGRLWSPGPGDDSPFQLDGNRFIIGLPHVFASGAQPARIPCPTGPAACDRARDAMGKPVLWPLALPRFTSRWLLLEGTP